MKRCLLLMLLVIWVLGLSTRPAFAFFPNDHRDITIRALTIIAVLTDCELSRVADAVAKVDSVDYDRLLRETNQYRPWHHFDRKVTRHPFLPIYVQEETDEQAFEQGADYFRTRLAAARFLFSVNQRELGMEALGHALHALQDFFSHSNFVDLDPAPQRHLIEALYGRVPLIGGFLKLTSSNTSIIDIQDPGSYSHLENSKDIAVGSSHDSARAFAKHYSQGAMLDAVDALRGGCDEEDGIPVDVVGALDPNDKIGSIGKGADRFVAGKEPFRYAINFENVDTATAPAQEVVLTDQLDPTTFDFDTFSLGPISFGSRVVTPPAGLSSYSTTIDLRPEQNLLVRITAALDKASGLLTARLVSLDPQTGKPPEDPDAGFLPPNQAPPEGQGSLLFSILPRAELATGTELRNQASIVFDFNAPILTPEWVNTVDNDFPVSAMTGLPAHSSTDIAVSWSGSDVGSGIQDYSIFVSDNGGPYELWLETTETSATFVGIAGHNYSFYSLARDAVGNAEAPKETAEASTTVAVDTTPPSLTLPADFVVKAASLSGVTITFAASALDVVDGARPVLCTPSSGSLFPNGVTTVSCSASDLSGNLASGTFKVTVSPPGDLDANGVVGCSDVSVITASYGKRTGQPGFNPVADVDGNGLVNVRDLTYVSSRLPPGTACQ